MCLMGIYTGLPRFLLAHMSQNFPIIHCKFSLPRKHTFQLLSFSHQHRPRVWKPLPQKGTTSAFCACSQINLLCLHSREMYTINARKYRNPSALTRCDAIEGNSQLAGWAAGHPAPSLTQLCLCRRLHTHHNPVLAAVESSSTLYLGSLLLPVL